MLRGGVRVITGKALSRKQRTWPRKVSKDMTVSQWVVKRSIKSDKTDTNVSQKHTKMIKLITVID